MWSRSVKYAAGTALEPEQEQRLTKSKVCCGAGHEGYENGGQSELGC